MKTLRRWRVTGAIAVVLTAVALVSSVSARSGSSATLIEIGQMKFPIDPQFIVENRIVHVDDAGRKMYMLYQDQSSGAAWRLVQYDLRSQIPRAVRQTKIADVGGLQGSQSPYLNVRDSRRNRLLMLSTPTHGENSVYVADLDKFKLDDPWVLPTKLPGFLPYGMTYSHKEDRVYLVGDFSHSFVVGYAASRKWVGPGSAVVALEAKTGDVAWVRPTPQCQQFLASTGMGALVARSRIRDALYFVCVTGGNGLGDTFPGQSGLIRLGISNDAGPNEALQFPLEFFPISGSYTEATGKNGIAGFDPVSDRIFLQSLSLSTPGAWVFDGRLSGWVGFVASPDNLNTWLGINERTGRYYMAGGRAGRDQSGGFNESVGPYLVATDARATPIPQGTIFRRRVDGFIPTDPGSSRLFIPVDQDAFLKWKVVKDNLPMARAQRPPDYDAMTSALAEGPKAVTSYSGSVNGYGTRTVLVGGYQGALNVVGQWLTLGQLRGSDRGITAARVPSVDLREAGAAASAQALVPDSSTEAELKENGAGDWPWTTSSCLDGGGTRIEDGTSDKGGTTAVSCNLGKAEAGAESSFGAVSGEGFSVGSSSFASRALKDPKLGVVTETIALARGIELSSPNGQSVSIARVASTARTAAHGHPGTTKVEWERVLSGIEIRDEKGKVVNRVGECVSTAKEDQCKAIARQINDALGFKMRLELPRPELIKTPKGAFAAVQQSDSDFYHGRTAYSQGTSFSQEAESRAIPALQLVIFNDSVERSRLLVQLAAIQANSIYTITPREEIEPPQPITKLPRVGDVAAGAGTGSASAPLSGGGSLSGGDIGASQPVSAAPVAAPLDIPGVLAFLVRSPKEALLVAGIWLLFGGAGGAVVRRRLLVGVLGGNS